MNDKLKNNISIILIITLFIALYFSYIDFNADLWWDSSVYIGMGKYIYSAGNSGLYEASRPLVWPLILGFFWKLGLDIIFIGKLLVLLFGIGTIILTYLIAHELFDEKIALLSSLLLAFSPTFFFFNSIMFTAIPSTFFVLLGLYLSIKKHHALSGLFFGIAFMTRFFQLLVIFPIYLFFLYLVYKKKATIKEFIISILFFLIPVVPYLILNFILFNNPFFPFSLQAYMTKFTGWIFNQPFSFYFVNLLKENVLLLFSILGIVFIFRNEKMNKFVIPFVFLFAFITYNFMPHKEMRFLLGILPFLTILTAYGIIKFFNLFKKYNKIILILVLIIGIFQIVPQLKLNSYDDKLDPFYNFVQNNNVDGELWISNPSFIVNTNLKADELIYFPLYNIDKMKELQGKVEKANYIFINTCDIMPCPPYEETCNQENENFLELLKENFNIHSNELIDDCEYYIFVR